MPSNIELKRTARNAMNTAKPHACVVALVYVVITTILSYLNQQVSGGGFYMDMEAYGRLDFENMFRYVPPELSFVSCLLIMALAVVSILLAYGFTFYALEICRGEPSGISSLFDGFSVFGKAILLELLFDIIIFLWSLLLIIPGFVASYAYSMVRFLLHDHPDWSVVRCMKESRRLMKGRKGQLFALDLSFIGWILLSMIPGVDVYVQPYMMTTRAVFYRNLIGEAAQASGAASEPTQDRPPWEY